MSLSVWSRFRRPWAAAVAVGVVVAACGSEDWEENGPQWPGIGDAGLDAWVLEGGVRSDAQPGTGGAPSFNELCGISLCPEGRTPDDPQACESYDGGAFEPPSSGGVPSSGGSSATNDSGAGGVSAGGAYALDGGGSGGHDAGTDGAVDGGAAFDASDATSSSDTGGASSIADAGPDQPLPDADGGPGTGPEYADAEAPPSPAPVFACHVHVDETRGVVHRCELAGRGGVDAACTSSRDCQPGLACVGDQNAGRCLEFCCDGVCPTATYCAERPLRLQYTVADVPLVPVCAPADNCKLDEPYGCTGQECSCPLGKTCSIVREDGTTACIDPGDGLNGDACDAATQCAAGYFCSAANTCLKICRTDLESAQCEQGRCQAAANFPEGMGLCVGLPLGR